MWKSKTFVKQNQDRIHPGNFWVTKTVDQKLLHSEGLYPFKNKQSPIMWDTSGIYKVRCTSVDLIWFSLLFFQTAIAVSLIADRQLLLASIAAYTLSL